MRFLFKELPGDIARWPRAAVPVVVEGHRAFPVYCLVDSGSLQNRFSASIAELCGIDLTGAREELIGLGGFTTVARTVAVRLEVGESGWEAPVSFCDPWPLSFQVLGLEGFFRWFKVTIRAAHFTIDLEPEES